MGGKKGGMGRDSRDITHKVLSVSSCLREQRAPGHRDGSEEEFSDCSV